MWLSYGGSCSLTLPSILAVPAEHTDMGSLMGLTQRLMLQLGEVQSPSYLKSRSKVRPKVNAPGISLVPVCCLQTRMGQKVGTRRNMAVLPTVTWDRAGGRVCKFPFGQTPQYLRSM